jgi:hypothetical protein
MERATLTLIHTKSCVIYPTFAKQSGQNGQFLSNPPASVGPLGLLAMNHQEKFTQKREPPRQPKPPGGYALRFVVRCIACRTEPMAAERNFLARRSKTILVYFGLASAAWPLAGTGRSIMPNIIIRCPVFGKAVPTGLSTETILFDSLDDIAIPMRCPACLKVHRWTRKDAWVDEIGESRDRG